MPLLPRIAPSRSSVVVLRDQKKCLLVASLLNDIIVVHQGDITLDTPTKEFPLSNAIRVSEAGSLVWKSSSKKNSAANIEHKIGFIGCEYVEEGRAIKPEEGDRTEAAGEEHSEAVELENEQLLEEKGHESFVLVFYMTYDAYNQPPSKKGTVPRVGEVLVHEHDVLQFCGVRPGDDLNTVLSKTIRFITPEMILTMLKHSIETQRGIVFRAVPVGREFADASENKELKVGDWILEARANPEQGIEQWVAHPMRSEATWLVRRFDERPLPHPPIPGHPISPGLQAQRVHFHGEETEC